MTTRRREKHYWGLKKIQTWNILVVAFALDIVTEEMRELMSPTSLSVICDIYLYHLQHHHPRPRLPQSYLQKSTKGSFVLFIILLLASSKHILGEKIEC